MRISSLLIPSAFVVLSFILPEESSAQSDFPIQEWAARYDGYGHGMDLAVALVVDDQGNAFVCGSIWFGGVYSHNYETIKYNTDGDKIWEASYSGAGSDYPTDIAIDTAMYTYMTGRSEGSGINIATVKSSPSGGYIWGERYTGASGSNDARGNAIAVDGAGNVYVTGYTKPSYGGSYDYVTIKYNSSGVEQWVALYNGPGDSIDQACDLEIDAAGNVYVTGFSMSTASEGSEDYATIKYNSSGVQQWVARYDGPGNESDYPRGIALDSDGNVYVTGDSPDSDYCDVATIKYSSSGTLQWVARYDSPGETNDVATDIGVGPDGSIYLTGGQAHDFLTIKYTSSGSVSWIQEYDWPYAGGDDRANALAIDASGDVFVTGFCQNGLNDKDYLTVRYSSSGLFMWAAIYSGVGGYRDDEARAIALDGGDGIYITGVSYGNNGTEEDFATVKYNANTGIEEYPGSPDFDLLVSPNPASSNVSVTVSLPEATNCTIRVFDIQGRIVDTIQDGGLPSGLSQLSWDAQSFPAGVYFLQADSGSLRRSASIVLVR